MVWLVLKPRQTKELPASRRAFRSALLAWFEAHGRDYPWRRTRDPYEVLVSEVMLQQTQIATVLGKGYYTGFLQSFPDVRSLAAAEDAPLLKAWEGLGYYRRARMLRETAKAVIEHHDGVIPSDTDQLLRLPGIGRYTAGALRAFAFELPAALVDGNVSRVFARLMDYRKQVDTSEGMAWAWALADELADDRHPRAYHSAVMELGQRICRPKQAECLECPVSAFCACRQPAELPLKKPRVKITTLEEHAIWIRNKQGQVLLHHEKGERRTGLWKLPLRDPESLDVAKSVAELNYGITRYKVKLMVHAVSVRNPAAKARKGDVWVDVEEVSQLAMAAPFRKVVERLLDEC